MEDLAMPKTCTHTITTERGRRISEINENFNGEQLVSHAQINDTRCLCFHHDTTIGEMIGSLDKPYQIHADLAQIDIGGIVKSLYIPFAAHTQEEDVVEVPDVWRQQPSFVACS